MRVMTMGDAVLSAAYGLLMLVGLGAAVGTIAWLMIRFPAGLPIWPSLGMAFAIGAMDRTYGIARRQWAWAAVIMGTLAVVSIIAT